MKRKYTHLLEDPSINRWYRNVCRGSKITGDIYLRRLGGFCLNHNTTPQDLLKLKERELCDLMYDFVTEMENKNHAGSYIKSTLKALKSWLNHNDLTIKRHIIVKGSRDTPTLTNERVPTQQELKKIFLGCDLKTRVICSLIAFSGTRFEVLGYYEAKDGLTLGDFPEMEITNGSVTFKKIPTMVVVRASISKNERPYFTFLCEEGCEYLKELVEMRLRKGEQMVSTTPLITPKLGKPKFIATTNIGDCVRKVFRKVGSKEGKEEEIIFCFFFSLFFNSIKTIRSKCFTDKNSSCHGWVDLEKVPESA